MIYWAQLSLWLYTLYATAYTLREGWAVTLTGKTIIYRVPFVFALYLPKLIAFRRRNGKREIKRECGSSSKDQKSYRIWASLAFLRYKKYSNNLIYMQETDIIVRWHCLYFKTVIGLRLMCKLVYKHPNKILMMLKSSNMNQLMIKHFQCFTLSDLLS